MRREGSKPLCELMLVSLQTLIYVTRVKAALFTHIVYIHKI